MARTVSRWAGTTYVLVKSQANPCGNYGGKTGTGEGFFLRVFRFHTVRFTPPKLYTQFFIADNTKSQQFITSLSNAHKLRLSEIILHSCNVLGCFHVSLLYTLH